MSQPQIAIAYDFDGTLAGGNLPEHGLLQDLGIDPPAFWQEVAVYTQEHDCDEIIAYMYLLAKKARQNGIALTADRLRAYGAKNIPFYAGIDTWFERINQFCHTKGLACKHYIVSSGIYEMIGGSSIGQYFDFIFASKYLYDHEGLAVCPSVAINYTTKTQFLFRINKGILNYWDHEAVNRWVPMKQRPIPFSLIIYVGDGDTDIPAMKMTRSQGGYSVAVFDPKKWSDPRQQEKIYKLIAEDRAQYVAPADYVDGSQLDIVVKGIIGRMANEVG